MMRLVRCSITLLMKQLGGDITKLEVLELGNCRVVKPLHECGTCGSYPKAWIMAYVSKRDNPINAFLKSNKNWERYDVALA